MKTKEVNQKYNDNEIIVAKSRNGVIKVNRIIVFLVIVGAIFGVIQWGWLSVPIVTLIGWVISIVNSIMVSNKVKSLTGFTHEEQAIIWNKMLSKYEKTLNQ